MAFIGTFPTTLGFTAVNFRQVNATKKTETASGRVVRLQNATTKWKGTLRFPPALYEDFLPVQAFVAKCQGSLNEFDIVIPEVSTHDAHPTQVTSPNGNANAGDTSIDIISDNINKSRLLHAGDIIRFHNHTKVYMVTDDVSSNGSGVGVINFQPPLITAVTSDSAGVVADSAGTDDAIEINNVRFRMILSNDIQEYNYRNDGFVEYEIDVEEVI